MSKVKLKILYSKARIYLSMFGFLGISGFFRLISFILWKFVTQKLENKIDKMLAETEKDK